MRTLFIALFLLIIGPNNVFANCIASYNENGIKIGVVGDSFFTTDLNSCNSFESLLKKKFNTNNVQNAAVGGATVLGFGNKAIRNQKLKFKPDILILSGGGNDFKQCGSNMSCLQQKLNSFVSNDLKSGAFLKLKKENSKANTKVFIIYTSIVATHAPNSWKALVKSGIGKKYSDRMEKYSSSHENVQWIDAANILDKNDKDHWLKDGFHPSSFGYELIISKLSNMIQKNNKITLHTKGFTNEKLAEAQSETLGELITNKVEKIQKGNIGLIDSYNKRIIEIDNTGKVIWETKIPLEFKKAHWNGGADIEWLSNSDTFLIAAPRKGFFEINRKGEILNSCKTKFISHDIDKLDDGSFIFVNGWDEKGKKEPILSKISNNCEILMSKSEDFFEMNKVDLQPRFAKDRANLHANAVRILKDKTIMVSVRNYDQVVIIKNNKIIKRFKKAWGVHDPSNIYKENGKSFFYYLNRGRPQSINKRSFDNIEAKPKKLWSSTGGRKRAWHPLRTLEKLENGNWLITGSQKIGQVTTDGELVWELYFPEFRHQKDKNKEKTYIYKVTFITKQN